MTRFNATSKGMIPFTPEEELAADLEAAQWAQGADTRAAEQVRNTRNELLSATDYYALTDVTMTQEMTTYRQALRDVPEQEGFPNDINWPEKPQE